MSIRTQQRTLLGRRCEARFYYPTEEDGPGTLAILEFVCVLRPDHRGPHQVENLA